MAEGGKVGKTGTERLRAKPWDEMGRCGSEGEKGAMENYEVWREGEQEAEKQSVSGNREHRALVKVLTKLVTKHLYALLSCVPMDHWGAFGEGPPERQGGSCSWPHCGWVGWLQEIISAHILILQRAETEARRGEVMCPGCQGRCWQSSGGIKCNLGSEDLALNLS